MTAAAALRHERSLASYLLVPRPRDAVKTLIAPVTYVVLGISVGRVDRVGEFVALWLILEFLVYYARYQWNDARGAAYDWEHPARGRRARLPVGASSEQRHRNIRTSLGVAGLRVLAALMVGAALGQLESVGVLVIAVFSVAAAYEALRSHDPPQLRLVAGPRAIGIWTLAGLGYAIRGGLGVALAGFGVRDHAMWIGLGYFAAFGATYVLLSWAPDATSFCASVGSRWMVSNRLRRKPHLSALLPYLARSVADGHLLVTSEPIGPMTPGYLGTSKVLDRRGALLTPWNVALLIGSLLAAAFGAALSRTDGSPASAAPVAICIAGALGLCFSDSSTQRWAVVAALTVVGEIATWAGHTNASGVAPLPWTALASCYAALRGMSYVRSIRGTGRRV